LVALATLFPRGLHRVVAFLLVGGLRWHVSRLLLSAILVLRLLLALRIQDNSMAFLGFFVMALSFAG
jgi:hypothetical protein